MQAIGKEPATIILEDVDLIGSERSTQNSCTNSILFELLNQMDGLAEDCDVLFVLTTNRPDILEPALASRPGRIDQAIEIPLPDVECRLRLFRLYAKGLDIQINNEEDLIKRLEGSSGAFIRELLRKSTVIAAEENPGKSVKISNQHLEEALNELVVIGGKLTQSLLGAKINGFAGS